MHASHEALTLHSPVAHRRSPWLTLLARCGWLKRHGVVEREGELGSDFGSLVLPSVRQYALSVANGPHFGCCSTGRTDCHQRGAQWHQGMTHKVVRTRQGRAYKARSGVQGKVGRTRQSREYKCRGVHQVHMCLPFLSSLDSLDTNRIKHSSPSSHTPFHKPTQSHSRTVR